MTAADAPKPHIHLPDGSCCGPRKFAHLHQHTQYSLLDGAAKLKDLLKWVKEVTPHDPACAMTDHGNMHGAVHFYNYAQAAQVKPILGYEAYVVPGQGTRRDKKPGVSGEKGIFHLTLLARDFEGYQNLCRLSSRGYTEGYYYKPRIDHELLQEHHKGVIAFSGCLGSEVQQLLLQGREDEARARLLWYRDLFGENYFIEIQDHGLPEQRKNNPILKAWAQELGIGMVATNDGHYVKKTDATAHETLLAIQTKATLADENRFKFPCDEFYVKNLEEMQTALPVSEWGEEPFDNTARIAQMCNVDLPVGKKRVYQMPALPIPEGRTMAEELRVQTYRGTVKRYPGHATEGLLRDYAVRSLEALGPEDAAKVIARVKGCDARTCDLETLFTLLAFMGSEWEARGKAAGEKYTPYPALEGMEAEAGAGTLPTYAHDDCRKASQEDSDTSIELDPGHPDEETTRAHHGHALVILRRAEYELSVINNMGFPDYFLIVADYINWAKDQDISVGPGRGSGAGSLVAYAMRITNLDPLEFELLFERFLNPDRISMPDFDIDFNDARRGEVIGYVQGKYGDDKVAQIATFGTMASKACLKDVARVMGLEYAKVDKVSKLIPIKFGKSYSLEQAREAVPDIQQMLAEDAQLLEAYEFAQKLEGLTRHASVHAAGVVIGRDQLTDLVPVMRDTSGEGMVCQYDMKAVEDIGLIKMDFLGLRTLSFLDEAKRILKESGTDFEKRYGSFDHIPFNDQKTFELLSRGDTKGVFQLEGAGITDASRRLKPRRLADIIALSALYRPGPMENIPTYVRRHHGVEEVDYVKDGFPNSAQWLEKILKETYGIPVYQEQIMQIASEVAGFSLGGADLLRRCLAEGTLILNAETGERVPVEQVEPGMQVLSLGPDYHFYKVAVQERLENGVQDVYRVRTRSGRQIELTGDHPLLTIEGWRHLSDLRVGDAIAVPVKQGVEGVTEPDPHRARVLALLIGDGNTYTRARGGQVRARFYSKNPELLQGFEQAVQALGARTARDVHPLTQVTTVRCAAPEGGHNPITALIREVGLDRLAHQKGLPAEVLTYTPAALARFLGDLWSTDGSVEATRISYASSSSRLIDELAHLLLRFGIVTMRRESPTSRRRRYELLITDQDDVTRFNEQFGSFLVQEKRARLATLMAEVGRRTRNQSIHLLPVAVTHRVREAKARSGRTWAGAGEAVGTPGNRLSSGLNFNAPSRALSRHRVGHLGQAFGCPELQALAGSEVLWDPIVAVEPVGKKRVYDLAVPPFANFVAADVVVHNSMGKKDAEEMKRQRVTFVEGAYNNGVPKEEGNKLFDLLDAFANYGFNKCLTGDTLIPVAGGELRRIEDLYREGQPALLPSMNGEYRLELRPTGEFFDNGVKPVFEVRTALGRRLTATANHPLLTLDGWRHLEDLQPGDRIAAPARLPELGAESWPEQEAGLLGWILVEGNTNHTHGAYLYSKNPEQVEDMVALASSFPNTRPTVRLRPDRQDVHDVYLGTGMRGSAAGKSGVRLWLEGLNLVGVKATERVLPAAAFRLNNASLAVLLGRYWSGDGFLFGVGNTTPFATTSSRRLADDLAHVLLRLGMVGRVAEKHFSYVRGEDTGGRTGYTVHLVGRRSIERFLEVVAPHIVGRGEQVAALRAHYAGVPAERETVDTLPASIKTRVQTAKEASGLTWREIQAQSGVCTKEFYGTPKAHKKGFRRGTIRQLGEFLEAPDLLNGCSDDLYWDTIVSIEAAGEAQTYDLEVPGTHNFVANGLVVHNSHSAAYGVITYQTAWLKANYPVEFMAALLTVERRDSDKVAEYVSDARKMDVRVLPPDINRSAPDFAVQGEEILFGLYAIKGLGEAAVQKILEERQRAGAFRSLADFCLRLGNKVCNRKAMESLIKSGAFDRFGERRQLMESLEDALEDAAGAAEINARAASGMSMMFGFEEVKTERPLRTGIEPYTDLARLAIEKEALGLYISGHPLEQHEGLREAASCRISDLDAWFTTQNVAPGKRVKAVLAGMIESVVKKPTKSGGMMARFILADESGQTELVAFSRAYDRIQDKLVNDTPALVIVELESEDGGLRAIAEEVVSVEQLAEVPKVMYVTIDLETATPDAVSDFQSILDEHAGSMPTYLRLETPEQFVMYQLDHGMGSPEAIRALNSTFPWASAYLAYDQGTILGRFAPKPPAWMNKGRGMQA